MDISDSQLKRSIERTEQRLADAHAVQRRQKFTLFLALLLVVLLIVAGGMVMGALSGRKAPPISTVALTWPSGARQLIGDGAVLRVEPNQTLRLRVPQQKTWNVTWQSDKQKAAGDAFEWKPQGNSNLTMRVATPLSGWRKILSPFYPVSEVRLRGMVPTPVKGQEQLREIETPQGGLWLGPHIIAKAPLRYDERALDVLSQVAVQLGPAKGDAQTPDGAVWQLIPAFTDEKPLPNDLGTNALLKTDSPADDARRAFKLLNDLAPQATIKVIVEKSQTAGEARFRLAFDDKAGRFVWVQGNASQNAEPEDWMTDETTETTDETN